MNSYFRVIAGLNKELYLLLVLLIIHYNKGYSETLFELINGPIAYAATNVRDNSFTANWQALHGAEYYEIDLSTNSSFNTFVINSQHVPTNFFQISNLNPNTTYYYRVRAVLLMEESGGQDEFGFPMPPTGNLVLQSTSNSNTITTITAPAPPSLNNASSVNQTDFTVSWPSVTGATSYRLDVSTNSNFTSILSGYNNLSISGTSRLVSGLAAGTTYFFRVRSVSSHGTSNNSTTRSILTRPANPGIPIISSILNNYFDISWNAVNSATGYRLDISTSSTFSSFISGYNNLALTSPFRAVTGLSPGVRYYIRVRAENSSGVSGNSLVVNAITIPPAPVAINPSSITSSSFQANWNLTTGASNYYFDLSLNSSFTSIVSGYSNIVSTSNNINIDNLAAGTTYFYRLRASNESGLSGNSNIIQTITIPLAPVGLNANQITASSFVANWGAATGAADYRLDVSTSNTFSNFVSGYSNRTVSGTSQLVSGLNPGITYYFRLRSVNQSGVSGNSIVVNTITLPAAPSATNPSLITSSGFTANWNSVTGASNYALDISTVSNFSNFVSGYNNLVLSGTSRAVTGLNPGTTYFYRVRALNASGSSTNSNTIQTITIPLAPVGLNANQITASSFVANWGAATGAADYRLDVSTSNTFSSFVSGYSNRTVSGTSQLVSGLNPGITYYFRLRSVNQSGASGNSIVVNTITLPAAPSATNPSLITSSGFTANWNSVTGASNYALDISTVSNFSNFVSGYNNLVLSGTSRAVTGLNPGTTYFYRVRALNTSGSSTHSNTIQTITVPSAPYITGANNHQPTQFTINWTNPSGVSNYLLDVSTVSNFSSFLSGYQNLSVSGSSRVISGLSPGTTYYFRIRASNASGISSYSNVANTITISAAPVALTATTVSNAGFTANWSSVTGAGSYLLDVSSNDSFTNIVGGYQNFSLVGNTRAITGLTPGITYYYRVRAVNSSGTSLYSNTIVTVTIPAAPLIASPSDIATEAFTANWYVSTGASSYSLDVSESSIFATFLPGYQNKSITNTTFSVTGLLGGTNYYYRVRAVNQNGTSGYSSTASLQTRLGSPQQITASIVTSSSFVISWQNVKSATSYTIDLSQSENFSSNVSNYTNLGLSNTSRIFDNLNPNSTYFIRVRAVNDLSISDYSSVFIVKTLPLSPVLNSPNPQEYDSFEISWNSISGITGYQIDVSLLPDFSQYLVGFQSKHVSANSIVINSLNPTEKYYVRVRSINGSLVSANSNVQIARTKSLPNFVKTFTYLEPNLSKPEKGSFPTDVSKISLGLEYFDGLGRPIQQVAFKSTPMLNDLIVPIKYDEFGRNKEIFLPYSANSTSYYKENAIGNSLVEYWTSEHSSFYSSAPKVAHDSMPYSTTIFEKSPLNRPVQIGAPGKVWQPQYGNSDKISYEFNTENEVYYLKYDENRALFFSKFNSTDPDNAIRYFSPGSLFSTVYTDGNGNKTVEFKDADGKVILKKSQVSETMWSETYYIYDDYDNLVIVLSPEGSSLLKNSANYFNASNQTKENLLKRYAFRYKYDGRKRMVEKFVPGMDDWVYMVYDNRDRLVLTQDPKQRQLENKEWLFTKYDALNRPVITGMHYTGANVLSREQMQTQVNNYYSNLGTNNGAWFESFNANASNDLFGFDNKSFPILSDKNQVLTVNYYDHYQFLQRQTESQRYEFSGTHMEGLTTYNPRVKGQSTGSLVKVLGEDVWMLSVSYFDDRYRPVQHVADNHKGGVERVSMRVDFVGKILETKKSVNLSSPAPEQNPLQLQLVEQFTYDHAGRLMEVRHRYGTSNPVLMVKNEYNELGELVRKNLHQKAGEDFHQNVDYRYNIRGWLTRINDESLSVDDGGVRDYFGMRLYYHDSPSVLNSQQQYNGNISAISWGQYMGEKNVKEQTFSYSYDQLNRLKSAQYHNADLEAQNIFTVSGINYDLNGNILALSRKDELGEPMDNLVYNYGTGENRSNRLLSVTDHGIKTMGFKDGNISGNDYSYDSSGNMVKDLNKGIDSISYNFLNLPQLVMKSGTGESVRYYYDATGRKLAQEVYNNSSQEPIKRTDYLGEQVYENDTLQFVLTSEGRIVPEENGLDYQYFLKDHLGNTRVTFATKDKVDIYMATLETNTRDLESIEFSPSLDNATIINSSVYNHTPNGSKTLRLSGRAANEIVGLGKVLKVVPGDSIHMEVYATYYSPETTSSLIGGSFLGALTGLFGPGAGLGIDGSGFTQSLNQMLGSGQLLKTGDENDDTPRAYINYILFDENFILQDFDFKRVTEAGHRTGTAAAHDKLELATIVSKPGYLYIYLSNENDKIVDVFFDDLKITHHHSPIIQAADYYPFGMTFNSYTAGTENLYKVTGKEEQKETGWVDFGARMYQPDLGRWFVKDPLAELYEVYSPYTYVLNNPLRYIDPDGRMAVDIIYLDADNNEIHRVEQEGAHVYYRVEGNPNELFWPGMGDGADAAFSVTQVESPVTVSFRDGVNQDVVSVTSLNTLQDIGLESRVFEIDVTSTSRDARGQATAMYNNLVNNYDEQRGLYRAPGQSVIDSYDAAVAQGLDRAGVIDAMTNTINNLGPQNVSRHAANPAEMNVLDISQRNIPSGSRQGFMNAANRRNGVRMLNENRVFHIEITQ